MCEGRNDGVDIIVVFAVGRGGQSSSRRSRRTWDALKDAMAACPYKQSEVGGNSNSGGKDADSRGDIGINNGNSEGWGEEAKEDGSEEYVFLRHPQHLLQIKSLCSEPRHTRAGVAVINAIALCYGPSFGPG